MFGFGNEKTRLENQYQKLLEEAYRLSHSNRKLSDQKHGEADAVLQKIQALEKADCDRC
jgi:hypothetical protein